ncbi:MAG: hypothetical protein JO257_13480 [Deltaproteobacteria bacterium]|nr:hypothetical protein [Deltaproteobacteria bacterium]
MGRYLALALALCAAAGCSKKKNESEGLPPAQSWSGDPSGAVQPAQQPANPHGGTVPDMPNPHGGGDPSNPHAGVDMTNPHGGDPSNPHAGVDMNNPHGGGDPTNPHAGMGADVSQLGLPPPDPDRPIDPSHHVKGMVRIHPKAKDKVKAGAAVFLIVKRADASGQPTGTPLAVEKLEWGAGDAIPFELSEKQAMIAGTQLTGDVVVIAHYDQDGDAISKQPGDVMGQAKVKIPADNVNLFLDDVLQ